MRSPKPGLLASVALATLVSGCAGGNTAKISPRTIGSPSASPSGARSPAAPGKPGVTDIYAADAAGQLAPEAAAARQLVYVPDDADGTVHVIDPKTYKVIAVRKVGRLPQHVTPAYDLKTLWVDNDMSNSLTPINPRTGAFGTPVKVDDPYNLYFTADGKHAVVVAERLRRLDFRDPHTMALQHSLSVPCKGIDHADFSADGRSALFSCEFSGQLVWVDMVHQRVVRTIDLPRQTSLRPKPQDVKLSPDGRTFYVADENSNGVFVVDAKSLRIRRFLPTGQGTHGLYVSRDSTSLYISNRLGGSISVLDFRTGKVRATWVIPGATPDMGGVSSDGKVLWLSGRYSREVYAISTSTGRLLARIKVGGQPHGLCVWPQPGRFSLGHTGVMR